MTKYARIVPAVEAAPAVHPAGTWDFDTAPTVAGVPIGVSDGAGGTAPPDATATVKGVVRLAGDLGGTAAAPTVPGLAGKADAAALAPVASSGAYTDLTGRPALAPVATSGAYADLTGTPAQPTLAPVATSGAYADLAGRPALAPVATSGAYADLTGAPTVPPAPLRVALTATTPATTTIGDVGLNLPNVPAGTYLVDAWFALLGGNATARLCRDTANVTSGNVSWSGISSSNSTAVVPNVAAAIISGSVSGAFAFGRGLLVLSGTKTVNLDLSSSATSSFLPGSYLELTKIA